MNKRRRYKAKAKRKARKAAARSVVITIVMDKTARDFFGFDEISAETKAALVLTSRGATDSAADS